MIFRTRLYNQSGTRLFSHRHALPDTRFDRSGIIKGRMDADRLIDLLTPKVEGVELLDDDGDCAESLVLGIEEIEIHAACLSAHRRSTLATARARLDRSRNM
jgi:hypothetical protein